MVIETVINEDSDDNHDASYSGFASDSSLMMIITVIIMAIIVVIVITEIPTAMVGVVEAEIPVVVEILAVEAMVAAAATKSTLPETTSLYHTATHTSIVTRSS